MADVESILDLVQMLTPAGQIETFRGQPPAGTLGIDITGLQPSQMSTPEWER